MIKYLLLGEILVKIGPVDSEIICLKGIFYKKEMTGCTSLPKLNSLKFINFTHNVARSSQMNVLKSEWQYYNPFWNVRATNKGNLLPLIKLLFY